MPTGTGPDSVRHPLFARYFTWIAHRKEDRHYRALRQELLAGLHGRVVEVGAGNGLNFPHYPASVTRLIAVEPEPYLRDRAQRAAEAAAIAVQVVDGVADRIPVPDGDADAVVVSGVLCSVPDVAAALSEVRRVLRPGGELRFFEHVRGGGPIRARYQDLAELVWPRLMGGCHANRDTLRALTDAGFRIERCRHFMVPARPLLHVLAPRVLGAARPG